MPFLPITPELSILIALLLPLVGGLGILLAGRFPNLREGITLTTALLLLLVVFGMLPAVLSGQKPELTLLEMLPGLSIHFQVEPLGMLFACVAAFLWPINSIYSIGYMRGNLEQKQTRFYFFFAVAISAAMGIAFAGNLITLFLFYEVLTLSTFPLVTHKGAKSMQSGRVYLGILISTSVGLLLPAIIWTWQVAGTTAFVPGGIIGDQLQGPLLLLLLFLFIYGIGKAAVMPVHRWLPAAMVAPTPVSALLHAVAVVKAGVFSVVKVVSYIFGLGTLQGVAGSEWLLYASGFTVVAASLIALQQDNLKRRLAYSTIGQLSYVVLGVAILAPISMVGAALHIVAHAFGKITLFFAAGAIYTASKKTEVSQLDGIGHRMPWTMGAFAIGALSMIGVPPAVGFISKWYILMGAFQTEQWIAIGVIVISTLLNAAYFMPIIFAAFFKPEAPGGKDHGEAPFPAVLALTLTAAMTLLMFLFPEIPYQLAQQIGLEAPQ